MLPFLLLLVFLTEFSIASHNGLSDELRFIHQEMASLRDDNHKQNMELTSLRETVQLQNKAINQHEIAIKELIAADNLMIKGDRPVSSTGKHRRKRPAQLIPIVSNLSGERKSDKDQPNRKQFYGPPTNCSDLSRLGYTLNGFYLVKKPSNDEKIKTKLDTIYCAFQQEGTYNPSLVEKPVIPSPFISPLFQNPVFHSPMFPPNDEVYFRFSVVRNIKKDNSRTLTFHDAHYPINEGNSFNGATGYFKAPYFGIYHFVYEMSYFLGIGRGNGTSVDFYTLLTMS